MVKKAREGVMEFLLINHPLDCPICDQGGECDLQDQSVALWPGQEPLRREQACRHREIYGADRQDGDDALHPVHPLRPLRRGSRRRAGDRRDLLAARTCRITTYLEHAAKSELSGNVVDLCPVGALTSKPYAFEARPWELKKTLAIDVMDAVGTNIRVDSRGRQVLRVVPRINDDVNEEWASDKTRHAVDGLVRKRLDRPYLRQGGKLVPATWDEAFAAIAQVARGANGSVAAIAGDQLDCETMFATRELVKGLGGSLLEGRQGGLSYDTSSLSAGQFQHDHRGAGDGRRHPARRHEPALGSAAHQHARPEGRAQEGRESLRHRAAGRSELQDDMARQ